MNTAINVRRPGNGGIFRTANGSRCFFIPVIPFRYKNYLVCEACNDAVELNRKAVSMLKKLESANDKETRDWIMQGFARLIENYQLVGKTDVQREYIRSARAQREQDDTPKD